MSRLMDHKRSKANLGVLPEMISAHNMTPHSRKGIAPDDIQTADANKLWIRRYERTTPKKVSTRIMTRDHVRLFARGYGEKWTREVFVVNKALDQSDPVTYKVVDLADEPIDGRFFTQKLQ